MKCWAWEYFRTTVAMSAILFRGPSVRRVVLTWAQPLATSAAPTAVALATCFRKTRREVLPFEEDVMSQAKLTVVHGSKTAKAREAR
jgi:hypothetical protein